MERVNIDRAAYEQLLRIAGRSDPPRVGLLGGRGGVVRSVYLLDAEEDRPERVVVTPEAAGELRTTIASSGEDVLGWFSYERQVSDDGKTLLPTRLGSGWALTLMASCPLPWISIEVDTSPPLGSFVRSYGARASARIIAKIDGGPETIVAAQIRVLEGGESQAGRVEARPAFLGWDAGTGRPVSLGLAERRQGLYVIGKTGTGKTTLLESLIVQDMEAGLGLCVLDPHGDLVNSVLVRVPPEREQSVVLLDLADSQYPFGLNLFECPDLTDRNLVGRVATQAVEVFEKLWGEISWGPQLAQILRNCAYTLIENQGYTLADIRRLLLHDGFRAKLVAKLSNAQVREFWDLEYGPMRGHEQQQLVRSTLNKVDEFLTPTVYPIVGFGRSTVNFRRAMDEGQILLVRLALGDVGAAAVSLIGSMIVGQLLNAALSRRDLPPQDRRQFNLYADEYHRFATPAFAELLAEARKFALATTLAHQFRGQLTDEPNRGATLNAANLVVFAVHGEDGEELAKQFDRTPPSAEVAGRRPKLTICQDPVGYLVRSGHDDESVRKLVAQRLQQLVHLARDLGPDSTYGRGYWYVYRSSIVSALQLINEYLVDLMEGRILVDSAAEATKVQSIVVELRGLLEFCPDADGFSGRRTPLPQATVDALDSYLEAEIASPGDQAARAKAEEILIAARKFAGPANLIDDERGRVAINEFYSMRFFVRWLRKLGAALATTPILVDSGQWELYYDKPRSYSDVEAEIASTLVNLPKYQARCRRLEGNRTFEHTIRTPEFRGEAVSEEAVAMAERIRERTRATYCVPLARVLEAMGERQGDDDGGTPAQRRVPLKG